MKFEMCDHDLIGDEEYVYILTKYEYDSYSYSGILPSEMYVHKTLEGAEKHAEKLGLKIMEYPENPNKDASIEKFELED